MWVGTVLVLCNNSKTYNVRRGQRTQHVLDVLPSKNNFHSSTRTSTVLPGTWQHHWGEACITARRADVYAMMMGSLTDDRLRHSPDYTDEANVSAQLVEKNVSPNTSHHVQSPGTAAPGAHAHIVFSAQTICNPNPRHCGIFCAKSKHQPKLLLCVRVRRTCFFSCFFVSPRGANRPEMSIFRKRLGYTVNSPGRLFTPTKSQRPTGRLLALLRYGWVKIIN